MGTIGGNLLQATRCWYWRLKFPCWLHGGERCLAKSGAHREHAVFGNERCASAHPSDPAAALVALGARLRTSQRELAVEELYRLPTDDDRSTTTLRPGELILELDVPASEASTYLKAMDRKVFSFPLVGVAAARIGRRHATCAVGRRADSRGCSRPSTRSRPPRRSPAPPTRSSSHVRSSAGRWRRSAREALAPARSCSRRARRLWWGRRRREQLDRHLHAAADVRQSARLVQSGRSAGAEGRRAAPRR